MKKFGKITAALVLLFLMSSIGVVNADTQITTDPANQFEPDISGNYIVYTDAYNINMYNLSTGIESQIGIDPLGQSLSYPHISGNRIIWMKNYFGTTRRDLIMYDLSTTEERPIYTSSISDSNVISNPAISGNYIVVEFLGNLYMYNLSDNTQRYIGLFNGPGERHTPAISGDRVVWVERRVTSSGIDYNIWMYNISTDNSMQITTGQSEKSYPAISGNYIVYTDDRNGFLNSDIYMYDLSEGRERQITTNTGIQEHPAISGDRIVWTDYRNGGLNPDIYMYNISTGRESPITLNASVQEYPAISGNRIVWVDSRNGNKDIYVNTYFLVYIGLNPDIRYPWLPNGFSFYNKHPWIDVFIEPTMPTPMPPPPMPSGDQSPEQPQSPDANDFDIPSIKLIISPMESIKIKELVLPVDKKAKSTIGDYDKDGILDLNVKFDLNQVINYLKKINKNKYGIRTEYEVRIIGNLKDGTPFESKLVNKELDKLPPP